MAYVDECIFCQIAQKKVQSSIVYEDDNFIAILDIHPANKGHTLVMPKNHIPELLSLNEEQNKEFFAVVQRVANGVRTAMNVEAFNLVQNNGPAAGQAIPHLHIHVIPRFEKDGLALGVFRQGKYEDNEISSVRDSIKSRIPEKKVERKIEQVEEKKEEPKKRSAQAIKSIKREIEIA